MEDFKIIFWIIALALLAFSIAAVSSRSILRSAIFLALALLSTAFIYMILGAELLAGIQILLYTGGIITLIIFALLITERVGNAAGEKTHKGIIPSLIISLLFFSVLIYFISISPRIRSLSQSVTSTEFGITTTLSETLFSKWVLPLEVLSLVLLASIIGALVIARKDNETGKT